MDVNQRARESLQYIREELLGSPATLVEKQFPLEVLFEQRFACVLERSFGLHLPFYGGPIFLTRATILQISR